MTEFSVYKNELTTVRFKYFVKYFLKVLSKKFSKRDIVNHLEVTLACKRLSKNYISVFNGYKCKTMSKIGV